MTSAGSMSYTAGSLISAPISLGRSIDISVEDAAVEPDPAFSDRQQHPGTRLAKQRLPDQLRRIDLRGVAPLRSIRGGPNHIDSGRIFDRSGVKTQALSLKRLSMNYAGMTIRERSRPTKPYPAQDRKSV